jgi:hypothetical protein
MKKSLIKGMAVLCASAAFVACSHDSVFDENLVNNKKELAYEQAFIQKYGKIDPNQSWDFKTFAASSRTRAEAGETSAVIEQLPTDESSFNWLWKYSDGETGELPETDLLRLWSVKSDIKAAIDGVTSKKWDPSKYENVIFRLFTICNDAGTKSFQKPYHSFGFSDGTHNYWLARGDSKYDYWYYNGNKFMDHTRAIDFTKLPDNIRWFAISQNSNDKSHEKPFYASEHKIEYFKEVTVTVSVTYKERGKNITKNYTETFWAFNTGAVGSNENIILWVKPTYKTPDIHVDVIKSKRYMCEDLGGVASSDIDFNDIVFDLVDTNGNQKCYVRALGGTLDIAIKVNGNIVFRKTTSQNPTFTQSQMYNTGWNGSIGVYSDINFDETLAEVDVTGWDPDANNVSVIVYNPTEKPAETIIEFPVVGAVPKMVAVDLQRNWKEEKAGVPDFAWFSEFDRK